MIKRSQNLDVLLFAEDPGGANVLAPLAVALHNVNIRAELVADEQVHTYLQARDISFTRYSGDADKTLRANTPQLFVTGTSERRESSSLHLIEAARKHGIPSLAAIDMITNADRRFRGHTGSPLAYMTDHIAVPDAPTAKAYEALGLAQNRITMCGHPHHDTVRARRTAFIAGDSHPLRAQHLPDAPTDRPVFIFLAEGADRLNAAASQKSSDYTLHGDGTSTDRTTIVLEEVLNATANLRPRPYVVLRLHPGNNLEDYSHLRPRIDAVSLGGDPLPLVWCANLVIGMTTMLLVEAYLLGKPTLSVIPRAAEREWLPTTASGLTSVVTTRSQLESYLTLPCAMRTMNIVNEDDVLPKGATTNYVKLIQSMLIAQ